jgi:hypothetical protein
MGEWNTPARNAVINKRPCDQKTGGSLVWLAGKRRSGGGSPAELHGGCLRSSLIDVFCRSRPSCYVGVTTDVPQIANELQQRPSWSRRTSCGHRSYGVLTAISHSKSLQ